MTCIKSKPKQASLCGRFPGLCDTILLKLDRPEDLGPRLRALYPNDTMTVLMTDERYLGHLDGQPGFITAGRRCTYGNGRLQRPVL